MSPEPDAEGPAGLPDRKAPGPTPRLADAHRQALAAQIDRGPVPASHGVVRWRLCDLGQWLWGAFCVSVPMQTPSRELRAMGYRKLSARPKHHAQAIGAIETTSPPLGTARPPAAGAAGPALCGNLHLRRRLPAGRQGGALVLPLCSTAAMNLHLAEISTMARPGRHPVPLLDQAGWHLSGEVAVPGNITLPPECPELDVMENVRRFMRANRLSNRVPQDHGDIVAHRGCHRNRLTARPGRIRSSASRQCTHRS